MKNTDMLEWMNDLDAKYLTEAERPVIRQRKKHRVLPALIAGAAAVSCMAFGVGAYMQYNQRMMQYAFGSKGEELMSDISEPQQVTAESSGLTLTVENVMSDGFHALLMLTVEPEDKSKPYDWTAFDHDQTWFALLVGGEQYDGLSICSGFWSETLALQTELNQRWMKVYCALPEGVSAETLADSEIRCVKRTYMLDEGETASSGTLLDGISVPVDLRQNTETLLMRAENGRELTISEFEMYQLGAVSAVENLTDFNNMVITWKDGSEQRISYGQFCGVEGGEGQRSIKWSEYFVTDKPELLDNQQNASPEDWCGIIDVHDVASFQFGDTVYYPVE